MEAVLKITEVEREGFPGGRNSVTKDAKAGMVQQ